MSVTNIKITHADSGLVTAEVLRAERISPTFVRVTVGGDNLAQWRHLGFDQWFRLALPVSDGTRFDRLSERYDLRGYLKYLTLPKATKPVIRSYTVAAFRPEQRELDIDFVIHGTGDEGVAGPWAASLPVGAPVALIDQGRGYRSVEGAKKVILAGEESALPAIAGILRDLPRDSVGSAVIEVPHVDDRRPVDAPHGIEVEWVVRDPGARPGTTVLAAVQKLGYDTALTSAFCAGEQRFVADTRRHLVNVCGISKSAIDFTSYWRVGRR